MNKEKLNSFKNIFFNKYNFVMVYGCFLMLRSVYFLQKSVDWMCKACLFWGILIICHDLWKEKIGFFKIKKRFFPIALCIAFGISLLLNCRYSLYGGTKALLYSVIYFFVLYDICNESRKDLFYKYFKRNNDVFITLIALITLASIITFVFGINVLYEIDGGICKIGFWYNRLNGVLNCNWGTIFGLISIGLSLVNWHLQNRGTVRKVLYIGNFVLQFIYYVLSGSRAATVCYAVMLGIWLILYYLPLVKERSNIKKAIFKGVLVVVLICATTVAMTKVTQIVMKQIAVVTQKWLNDPDAVEDQMEEIEIDFERVEDFNSGDITNNRSGMWKAAFKIIKQHPIWGVSHAKALDTEGNLKGNIDDSEMTEKDLSALKAADAYYHNGFIQILLCSGIVGFVTFFIWVFKTLFHYLECIRIKDKSSDSYKVFIFIFAMIGALFVDNIVEVHLLFGGQDAIASLFWFLLGCGIVVLNDLFSKQGEKYE